MKSERRKRAPTFEKRFTQTAKRICIGTALSSLIYHIVSLCTLSVEKLVSSGNESLYGKSLKVACHVLPRVEIFTVIIGMGLVYLFLWTRQRVFYISASLKTLNSNSVRVLSHIILILWVFYFVPAAIVYCILVDYVVLRPGGCQVMISTVGFYRNIIISWVSVSIFMQIALLGLFIKPIIHRALIRHKRNIFKANKLLNRVKKAIALTMICLLSDIVAAVVTLFIFRSSSNYSVMAYHINLVINMLATIACFDDWATMLWPWGRDAVFPHNSAWALQGVSNISTPSSASTGMDTSTH